MLKYIIQSVYGLSVLFVCLFPPISYIVDVVNQSVKRTSIFEWYEILIASVLGLVGLAAAGILDRINDENEKRQTS